MFSESIGSLLGSASSEFLFGSNAKGDGVYMDAEKGPADVGVKCSLELLTDGDWSVAREVTSDIREMRLSEFTSPVEADGGAGVINSDTFRLVELDTLSPPPLFDLWTAGPKTSPSTASGDKRLPVLCLFLVAGAGSLRGFFGGMYTASAFAGTGGTSSIPLILRSRPE